MELTKEQLETVRSGASVRLSEGDTDVVVMRADLFERLRRYDDSPWTDEEMDLLAAEDAHPLGRDGMDAVAAIKEGLGDVAAGRTRPIREALDELATKHQLRAVRDP